MNDFNPIGILDSGIGGVTVLKEILKVLPNENYIYYSDSINNPYGEKTEDQIYSYVDNILNYFIDMKCKAIVFACNTATAITIESMRKKYPDLILIGIEPAYKMVHDLSNNKKTLIMATPATLKSKKFLDLYHKYDNHNTYLLPCDGLASLIEEGNKDKINAYLLNKLPKNKFDVVVLGCTHYPLIKNQITNILGNVIFYDGSIGVANRLKNLLEENNLISSNGNGSIIFYDSLNNINNKNRFLQILNN